MKLSRSQTAVIRALAAGATLKSHRHLDGTKEYKLHRLDDATEPVSWNTVTALKDRGLIDSNKKFPAATYLLTQNGATIASELTETEAGPLSARNF